MHRLSGSDSRSTGMQSWWHDVHRALKGSFPRSLPSLPRGRRRRHPARRRGAALPARGRGGRAGDEVGAGAGRRRRQRQGRRARPEDPAGLLRHAEQARRVRVRRQASGPGGQGRCGGGRVPFWLRAGADPDLQPGGHARRVLGDLQRQDHRGRSGGPEPARQSADDLPHRAHVDLLLELRRRLDRERRQGEEGRPGRRHDRLRRRRGQRDEGGARQGGRRSWPRCRSSWPSRTMRPSCRA